MEQYLIRLVYDLHRRLQAKGRQIGLWTLWSLMVMLLPIRTYAQTSYPYIATSYYAPLTPAMWDAGTAETLVVPRVNACSLLSGGRVFVQLSSGESHDTGKTPFSIPQVSVLVTFSSNNAGGLTPTNYTRTLTISNDKPEMQAVLDIPARFLPSQAVASAQQGSNLTVWVRVRSQGTPSGTLPPNRQIIFRVEPEYFIHTLPLPTAVTPTVAAGSFEQTLSWTIPNSSCNTVRNFQIQLLHRPSSATAGQTPTDAEWAQQGLLFETGSGSFSHRLTLSEGEGTYHWRVRAVGNLDGGIANRANWGPWSQGSAPFQVLAPNPGLNWIYSRTFTEGGRVAEKLTVADGLQHVRQVQTRLGTPGQNQAQTITTQMVQDYAGRNAVSSLPIPVPGDRALGYKKKLLIRNVVPVTSSSDTSTYNPAHFDSDVDGTVFEPVPAKERDYYTSETRSNNARVPDAEGYPFTRTSFANDGTDRVSAQGGVGQALHYRSKYQANGTLSTLPLRTVRTDYTDVAPAELIRVFGPEAPEADGTYKIMTTDPNGVVSVTYQSKEGQTLATALSRTGVIDSTLLVPLASATDDEFRVSNPIRGQGRIIGKPLVLTEEKQIQLDYSITPSTIAASCPQYYCATCDYPVKLRIINTNPAPGSSPVVWETTLVVPFSQTCSPNAVAFTGTQPPALAAGTYRVERELVPLNYYPLPSSAGTVTPRLLADHLAGLRSFLTASTSQGDWATIQGHLQNARMAELYVFLDEAGYSQGTDSNGPYYSVPISNSGAYPTNCVRAFKIPILSLSCAPQLTASSYEQELIDKLTALNIAYPNATRQPADIIPGFTPGIVNALIANMLAAAGTNQVRKDQIRNCWVSLLNLLPNNAYGLSEGSDRRVYNLLDDFLNCTGVSMTTPVALGPGSTAIDIAHADQQYLYDPASPAHQACFVGAYSRYLAATTPTNSIPPAGTTIQTVITAFNALATPDKITYYNSVYSCIRNAQSNPTPQPATVTTRALAEEGKVQAELFCRKACDARWAEFLIAVVEQLHRTNTYVEGDRYQWATVNGRLTMTQYPLTSTQLRAVVDSCQLYFMTQELVDACKSGNCSLTVEEIQQNGNVAGYRIGTEAEFQRMQRAMFHRIDLYIDLTGTSSCPITPPDEGLAFDNSFQSVPKLPGNTYQRVGLTDAARLLVRYMSDVHKGANRLMGLPNRPAPYFNTNPGFHEIKLDASAGLSNVFDYKGQIPPGDLPMQLFDPFANALSTVPANYWVQVRDDRKVSPTRDTYGLAFNQATDFLLLWKGDGSLDVFCPSGICRPGATNTSTETTSKTTTGFSVIHQGGYSDLMSACAKTHYVMHLEVPNSSGSGSTTLLKSDIHEILDAVYLAPAPQPLPAGMADPFSSEFVQVRVRKTDGTVVVANVVATAYSASGTNNCSVAVDPGSRMVLWKSLGRSCVSNNRTYTLCYRWAELPVITPPQDGVFTNQPLSCAQQAARDVSAALAQQIANWEQAELAQLTTQFMDKCVALQNQQETFGFSYDLGYYHYTLYYYDRAGNLVKTIPPAGVMPLSASQLLAVDVENRATWATPVHTLPTSYTYNSLHQLVKQQSPDGGLTQFYYNSKGQLRFSQNAKQVLLGRYSYTRYDALGRVIEVGESNQDVEVSSILTSSAGASQAPSSSEVPASSSSIDSELPTATEAPASGSETKANIAQEPQYSYSLVPVLAQIEDPSFPSRVPTSGPPQRWQITRTFYSQAAAGLSYLGQTNPAKPQRNLQNRVSYSDVDVDGDYTTTTDRSTTYYSYDPHGNVEWLAQEQPVLGRKYVRYEYDLVSNKVLKVLYQDGQTADQFYHRYTSDADNRLTEVFTSADNIIWDRDARYEYYAHGPLKRMELGEDQVQGVDYTYTMQGGLKGINHPTVDPGGDGASAANTATAADAFGMTLGYFPEDFKSNSSLWTSNNSALREPQATGTASRGLYNGNIATWTSHTRNDLSLLGTVPTPEPTVAEQYRYDQLNRLIRSNHYERNGTGFALSADYLTKYSYDPNGNLLTLDRNGSSAMGQLAMDKLAYTYKQGNNQLTRVDDAIVPTNSGLYQDIKPAVTPVNEDQYLYDAIGNLVKSKEDGVSLVEWNVYGKITHINMLKSMGRASQSRVTDFRYDAAGNRIAKTVVFGNLSGTYQTQTTFYVRDAQGNVLATYDQTTLTGGTAGAVTLQEHSLYGSSRLGVRLPGVSTTQTAGYFTRSIGLKKYELTDHLGNVRALVSDIKLPESNSTYKPDLLAYYNYYPFGMMQPGRANPTNGTSNGGYRYGFNGKEMDNNSELGLATYDYGFRIYNPGIVKFLSEDPLTKDYPELTPYQFASNRPIDGIDLDGKEFVRAPIPSNTTLIVVPTTAGTAGSFKPAYQSVIANTNVDVVKANNLPDLYDYLSSGSNHTYARVIFMGHGTYGGSGLVMGETKAGAPNSRSYSYNWFNNNAKVGSGTYNATSALRGLGEYIEASGKIIMLGCFTASEFQYPVDKAFSYPGAAQKGRELLQSMADVSGRSVIGNRGITGIGPKVLSGQPLGENDISPGLRADEVPLNKSAGIWSEAQPCNPEGYRTLPNLRLDNSGNPSFTKEVPKVKNGARAKK